MSDLHYFVIKVSEDQVPRFKREMCYSFELVCCTDCEYDHNCNSTIVRASKSGNVYCPVQYCSAGKRKEE